MLNNVTLQGKITSKGVENSVSGSGTVIAKFSVNYSEKINGEWKNSFFECVAFGKIAEMLSIHFPAGSPIILEGKLQQDTWDDKNSGQKRSKVSIIINKVHFQIKDNSDSTVTPQAPKQSSKNEDLPF